MGIIERKQRTREEIRIKIMEAALNIARADGWNGLSMRKIAEQIEYTAPVIYEYFNNKEDLLTDLSRLGFQKLAKTIKNASEKISQPIEKLENMWEAYWKFAFSKKEFYQLMFGVGISSPNFPLAVEGIQAVAEIMLPVIRETLPDNEMRNILAQCRFYTYWSAYHGLISPNLLSYGHSDRFNEQVLAGIMQSIKITDGI